MTFKVLGLSVPGTHLVLMLVPYHWLLITVYREPSLSLNVVRYKTLNLFIKILFTAGKNVLFPGNQSKFPSNIAQFPSISLCISLF